MGNTRLASFEGLLTKAVGALFAVLLFIVLLPPCSYAARISNTVSSVSGATTLTAGAEKTASISDHINGIVWFSFKPAATGIYQLYSESETNLYGALFCKNGSVYQNMGESHNDDADKSNVCLTAFLKSGATYYLAISEYYLDDDDEYVTSFKVGVRNTGITSLSIDGHATFGSTDLNSWTDVQTTVSESEIKIYGDVTVSGVKAKCYLPADMYSFKGWFRSADNTLVGSTLASMPKTVGSYYGLFSCASPATGKASTAFFDVYDASDISKYDFLTDSVIGNGSAVKYNSFDIEVYRTAGNVPTTLSSAYYTFAGWYKSGASGYELLGTDPLRGPADYGTYYIRLDGTGYMKGSLYVPFEIENPVHTHEWGRPYVNPKPTCTTEGKALYVCPGCGESKTEVVAALGHTPVAETASEATCTSEGLVVTKCSRCGETLSQEVVPALGHDPQTQQTKAPTCTEEGTETVTCKRCGSVLSQTAIPALGHKNTSEIIKEPTCTESGQRRDTCQVCGTVALVDIDPLGHQYPPDTVTDATCTKEGTAVSTCLRCGKTAKATFPALGHDFKVTQTKAATCTEGSSILYTCSRCGETKTETQAALGHDFKLTKSVNATCMLAGYSEYTCSRCGETKTEAGEVALGHDYQKTVTKEPQPGIEGEATYVCSRCKDSYTEAIKALDPIEQTIIASNKKAIYKAKVLKVKAIGFMLEAQAEGQVSFSVLRATTKKIKVASNGKVTLPKGLKKGRYVLKVTVSAAATQSCKAAEKLIAVIVKIK